MTTINNVALSQWEIGKWLNKHIKNIESNTYIVLLLCTYYICVFLSKLMLTSISNVIVYDAFNTALYAVLGIVHHSITSGQWSFGGPLK